MYKLSDIFKTNNIEQKRKILSNFPITREDRNKTLVGFMNTSNGAGADDKSDNLSYFKCPNPIPLDDFDIGGICTSVVFRNTYMESFLFAIGSFYPSVLIFEELSGVSAIQAIAIDFNSTIKFHPSLQIGEDKYITEITLLDALKLLDVDFITNYKLIPITKEEYYAMGNGIFPDDK